MHVEKGAKKKKNEEGQAVPCTRTYILVWVRTQARIRLCADKNDPLLPPPLSQHPLFLFLAAPTFSL